MEIIENIVEYLDAIKKIMEKNKNKDLIFSFRGEPDDFKSTKLQPSLFRNIDISKILETERRMFESIIDYRISEGKSCIEKSIDSQHYIAFSRLLDVSFNVMNALYFSLGEIYTSEEILDRTPTVYIFKIPKFLAFSVHSEYLEKFFSEHVCVSNKTIPTNIKLIQFSLMNDRVIAQDGGFILFPSDMYVEIPSLYYEKITITRNVENLLKIQSDLRNIFNISTSKIFPERERSRNSILKDLNDRVFYECNNINYTELEIMHKKIIYEIKELKLQMNNEGIKKDTELFEKYKKHQIDNYRKYVEKFDDNKKISIEDIEKEIELL